MAIITTEQIEAAADKLEALKADQQSVAVGRLRHEHLCALDLVLEGRGSAKARAAHVVVQTEMVRRAAIRAENEAIAAAKAARRAQLDKVIETFAKGVEVTVPGHPGVTGELFVTGRRRVANVVDPTADDIRDGWAFRDGWDVVWGAKCGHQVWFSNDQIAAAQIDTEGN